jgi:hypothetical protein
VIKMFELVATVIMITVFIVIAIMSVIIFR